MGVENVDELEARKRELQRRIRAIEDQLGTWSSFEDRLVKELGEEAGESESGKRRIRATDAKYHLETELREIKHTLLEAYRKEANVALLTEWFRATKHMPELADLREQTRLHLRDKYGVIVTDRYKEGKES